MPTASSPRRRRLQRLRRARRRLAGYLPYVIGVCLILLVFLGYIAVRGMQAGRDAAAATSAMSRAEAAMRAGDITTARAQAQRAARLSRSAERDTGGAAWQLALRVPGLRGPANTTRVVTLVVDDVARRVVLPLSELQDLRPSEVVRGTTVHTATLTQATSTVASAATTVKSDIQRLDTAAPTDISPIDSRIDRARSRLHELARQLRTLDDVVRLTPVMFGDGRRYLMLVQNNAESRATGGLVGAYALVEVRGQQLVVDRAGPNNELRDATAPVISVDAPFSQRYDGLGVTTSWRSLNLTPDFPAAATVAAGLWQRQGLPAVDGVLAVDPPALAALLSVTGSVEVPGGPRLTAQNAVSYLESGIYAQYPRAADAARNAYLAQATRAVVDSMRTRGTSGASLMRALVSMVAGGHLQIWSAHPDEQRLLGTTQVSGALAARGAPYLQVVTQNLTGGKVDYYLRRRVRYIARRAPTADNMGSGPVPMDDALVTVRLTNTAPATGLPSYVTVRADKPPTPAKPGTDRLWLSLYFPRGTGYTAATLDGRRIALHTDSEAGSDVMSTVVSIAPGESLVLAVHVLVPAPAGSTFTYVPQPLATPDDVQITRR